MSEPRHVVAELITLEQQPLPSGLALVSVGARQPARPHSIVVARIAGLLAGGFSMAVGDLAMMSRAVYEMVREPVLL